MATYNVDGVNGRLEVLRSAKLRNSKCRSSVRATNVMPTDLDVCNAERCENRAQFGIEFSEAFHDLVDQGWVDAVRELGPGERA